MVIVDNRAPAWKDGAHWSIDPTPVVDLGSADAAREYQFQNIVDAVRLPDGGYAVADNGRLQVLFYDAAGRYRATAGRKGGGPGEFRWVQALAVTGDSVLVYDPELGRLTLLAPNGDLRGTVQLAETGDQGHALHTHGLAGVMGGHLVLTPRVFMPGGGCDIGMCWDSAALLAYTMTGDVVDTVAEPVGEDVALGTNGFGIATFGAFSQEAVARAFLFVTDTRTYEIHAYRPDGRMRRVIRRAWQPRPVTSDDRDRWVRHYVLQSGASSVDDPHVASLRHMLEASPVADHMPALLMLKAEPNSTLWVADCRAPWATGPMTWSVFDTAGIWLGQVRTPDRFTVLRLTGDAVLGVQRDSLDVQHFQVLRVNR